MKLVEILARELGEWPEVAHSMTHTPAKTAAVAVDAKAVEISKSGRPTRYSKCFNEAV